MRRFEGKSVLITGAASGIGRATAERMASEGAQLFLLDVQAQALEDTAKAVRELGADVETRARDVSDPDAVRGSVEIASRAWGRLAALCNVARILHFDHTLKKGQGRACSRLASPISVAIRLARARSSREPARASAASAGVAERSAPGR